MAYWLTTVTGAADAAAAVEATATAEAAAGTAAPTAEAAADAAATAEAATAEAATDAAATAEAVLLYNICRVSGFEPKILRLQSGVLPMCYIYLLNNEHTPIELNSPPPNLWPRLYASIDPFGSI